MEILKQQVSINTPAFPPCDTKYLGLYFIAAHALCVFRGAV